MKILLVLLASIALVACGGSQAQTPAETETTEQPSAPAESSPASEPESQPQTAASDVLPNDGTRQVGDVTACPVSGEVFEITAESPAVTHDGGTYYTCCAKCAEKFSADPEKFLGSTPDPAEHDHSGHHHDH